MGAVDFGIIVDGGVVIIESIVHRLLAADDRDAGRRATCATASSRAVAEVVRPTVFSLLIIIAAYLPIFLLERVEGRIFAPMANTVVAALLGALLFSVTLVPVLAPFAYRRPLAPPRVAACCAGRRAAYEPTLRWALRAAVARARRGGRSRLAAAALRRCRGSAPSSCPSSTRARST